MQNYHPKERGHAKLLARRYFRTTKPWSKIQLAQKDNFDPANDYTIKQREYLDREGKDPKTGVSVGKVLACIDCPKPWNKKNEIYNLALRRFNDWYEEGYLGFLPEQLETTESFQINSSRRGPYRKIQSDTWRLFF
jgi:hypothetical protein